MRTTITLKDVKTRIISSYNTETGKDEVVYTERLGGGSFCEAYKDTQSQDVYLFMNEDTYCPGKEIVERCEQSLHLPRMHRQDNVEKRTFSGSITYNVWCTDYSEPLRAKDKEAWKMYKTLKAVWELAIVERRKAQHGSRHAHSYGCGDIDFCEIAGMFLDLLRMLNVDEILVNTLQEVCDTTMDYGDAMWLEFAPRNLGVSPTGELILRDIVFDRSKFAERKR